MISDVGALPESFEKSLRDYVHGGGSVLVALGRTSMGRDKVPVADLAIPGTRYAAAKATSSKARRRSIHRTRPFNRTIAGTM